MTSPSADWYASHQPSGENRGAHMGVGSLLGTWLLPATLNTSPMAIANWLSGDQSMAHLLRDSMSDTICDERMARFQMRVSFGGEKESKCLQKKTQLGDVRF